MPELVMVRTVVLAACALSMAGCDLLKKIGLGGGELKIYGHNTFAFNPCTGASAPPVPTPTPVPWKGKTISIHLPRILLLSVSPRLDRRIRSDLDPRVPLPAAPAASDPNYSEFGSSAANDSSPFNSGWQKSQFGHAGDFVQIRVLLPDKVGYHFNTITYQQGTQNYTISGVGTSDPADDVLCGYPNSIETVQTTDPVDHRPLSYRAAVFYLNVNAFKGHSKGYEASFNIALYSDASGGIVTPIFIDPKIRNEG